MKKEILARFVRKTYEEKNRSWYEPTKQIGWALEISLPNKKGWTEVLFMKQRKVYFSRERYVTREPTKVVWRDYTYAKHALINLIKEDFHVPDSSEQFRFKGDFYYFSLCGCCTEEVANYYLNGGSFGGYEAHKWVESLLKRIENSRQRNLKRV